MMNEERCVVHASIDKDHGLTQLEKCHTTPVISRFTKASITPSFLTVPLDTRGRLTSTPNIVHMDPIFTQRGVSGEQNRRRDDQIMQSFGDLKGALFTDEADSAIEDSQTSDITEWGDSYMDVLRIENTKRKRSESSEASCLSGIQQLSSDSNDSVAAFENLHIKTPFKKTEITYQKLTPDSNLSLLSQRQDSGIGASFLSTTSSEAIFSPSKRASLEHFTTQQNTPAFKEFLPHQESIFPPVFKNKISFSPPARHKTNPASIATRLFKGFDVDDDGEIKLSFDTETCKNNNQTKKNKTENKVSGRNITTHIIGSLMDKHKLDIISELYKQDLCHIITKIFSQVRQKDVLRCTKVCKSWDLMCNAYPFMRSQISQLRSSYKARERSLGVENADSITAEKEALLKTPSKHNKSWSDRSKILGCLQPKSTNSDKKCSPMKHVLLPTTPSGKNRFVPARNKFDHNQRVKKTLVYGEKLLPCPHCLWTAKIYNSDTNRGQCYNPDCRFRFCAKCSIQHSPSKQCENKIPISPKAVKIVAGSRKSMKNIKRRLR